MGDELLIKTMHFGFIDNNTFAPILTPVTITCQLSFLKRYTNLSDLPYLIHVVIALVVGAGYLACRLLRSYSIDGQGLGLI